MLDPTKLSYVKVFGLEGVRHVASSMKDQGAIKMMIAVAIAMHGWFFPLRADLVTIVFALVAFDTITGFLRAYRWSQVSSSGFFRFALKMVVFYIMLATASLLDRLLVVNLPVSALALTCGYLATTEALSILENISELGFPVPSWLVSLLRLAKDKEPISSLGDKK